MDEMSFEGCSVIFRDVLECYKPKEDIACVFSVKEETLKLLKESKQENDCFVGIFLVGWDSLFSSITKRSYSLIESVSEKSFQVVFQGDELPDENIDEYYQFCFYNVKTEVVYGASCPFQICESKLESFVVCNGSSFQVPKKKENSGNQENMQVWMEDNDDDFDTVLVVKKDTESEFKVQNEILKKEAETMKFQSEKSTAELNRLTNDNEMKERRAKILEESIADSEKVISHLKNQMIEMRSAMEEYEAKIKELASEKESLESSRAKAHFENNLLKSDFKDREVKLSNEIETLQHCLENEKKSRNAIEDEYHNILAKIGELKDAHGKEIEETKQIEAKFIEAVSNLKVEKQKVESLSNQNEDLTNRLEALNTEKQAQESFFLSKQEYFQGEIESVTDQLQKMTQQVDELKSQNDDLKKQEVILSEEVNACKSQNAMFEREMEEVCQVKSKEIDELTQQIEMQTAFIEEKNAEFESLQVRAEDKDKEILTLKYQAESQAEETQNVIESMRMKLEELQTQGQAPQETKSISMSKSEGSYFALQVAYNFIQKQLKQFKAENEELKKHVQSSGDSLQKEVEDLKLRLKFGKEAFENKFKECQKLKSELKETQTRSLTNSSEPFDDVVHNQENLKLQTEVHELRRELELSENREQEMRRKIEETNDKMKQYDDNMKLLREENKLLKFQVSALLEGKTSTTIRRKFDPELGEVIYQPPSFQKSEIAYPPSMNKIDRPKAGWLPSAQPKPNNPPTNQIIPNRETTPSAPAMSLTLQGRGKTRDGRNAHDEPTHQCPVCQLPFPVGYSEATATAHVNEHFTGKFVT